MQGRTLPVALNCPELEVEIVCPASFPGTEKLTQAVPLLADDGVTAVEVWIDRPEYFDTGSGVEIQAAMSQFTRCGVRVHSVHSPFGSHCDISHPTDKIHERGVDALIESIEIASVLEAQYVIVHASDLIDEANGITRRLDRARGVLREMAVVAEQSGIVLALENLPPGYLGHTPEQLFQLLDGTDETAVAICFDTGHANLSGRFEEFAEMLLPRSVTTHLHDNDGAQDQHQVPGEGIIDWPRFARTYRESGSDAGIMLECRPPNEMPWSQAFQLFRSALGD